MHHLKPFPLNRLVIFTMLYLATSVSLSGQEKALKFSPGFMLGANFTNLTGYKNTRPRGPNFINAGLVLRFSENSFVFEVDIIVLETGVKFDFSSQTNLINIGDYDRQVNTNLLFPVLIGYKTDFRVYIMAGPYFMKLLEATYVIPDFIVPTSRDNKDEFKNNDFGFCLSISFNYYGRSSIGFRGNWGFRDINNDPGNRAVNYTDTSNKINNRIYQIYFGFNF